MAAFATELDQCPDAGLEGFTGRAIRNTVASARELLSALGESPWMPIESAPKDGTWIYVIGPEYETPMPAQWGLLNINPNKYDGAHGWSGNGYIFGDAALWKPIEKDWPHIPVPCDNCDGTGRYVVTKVVTAPFKAGDVATAPSGNKWTRLDNGWWRAIGSDGADFSDTTLCRLGFPVTREGPDTPAFIEGRVELIGGAVFGSMRVKADVEFGWRDMEPCLVARDTPENRAALESLQRSVGKADEDDDHAHYKTLVESVYRDSCSCMLCRAHRGWLESRKVKE